MSCPRPAPLLSSWCLPKFRMRVWTWFCVLLANLVIAIPVSSEIPEGPHPKPIVVSSIRPLQLIVDEIAGDLVDSRVLLGASASPHDFSLTIAQALMLADTDLLVWVGPKMERFLQSGVRAKSILAMDQSGGFGGQSMHKAHRHDSAEEDPHLWLSQQEVETFSRRLVLALLAVAPANKAIVERRLELFLTKLRARHQQNRVLLAPFADQGFAVYHDAYYHVVGAYGLKQAVSLTQVPHERLSAKRLNEAGQKMMEVSCLLSESAEAKQALRYANLFEKPLITIDLLAADQEIKDFDAYLERIGLALYRCINPNLA